MASSLQVRSARVHDDASEDAVAVSPPLVQAPIPETSTIDDVMSSTTSYGTYEEYHNIEVRSAEAAELSTSGGADSLATTPSKRFTCQFDPGSKNGRVLVLQFDRKGESNFKEMSRLEVLRITQEAAVPKAEPFLEHGSKTSPPMRKFSGIPNAKGWRPSNAGAIDGGYAPVCDVQRVHSRDIRKMENAFSVSNEPSVVIRRQAVLISADPLRAIVMRDSCLVYVPDGADSLLTILKAQFRETTREADDAPYEFRALEALLATLSRYFQSEYEKLAPSVVAALDRLVHGHLRTRELETLREFKNQMHEFQSQVDGVRRILMELLDSEEDLRLLYLSKLHEDPSLLSDLWSFDSEEAEVLVENYLQNIFTTRTKAELMQHRITNTESLVMLKLDSMRNYLLGVDLIFSLVAISLSVGTFITGVFGMNLASGLEQAAGWFGGVVIVTVTSFVLLVASGVLYFKRQGVLLL